MTNPGDPRAIRTRYAVDREESTVIRGKEVSPDPFSEWDPSPEPTGMAEIRRQKELLESTPPRP